MSPKQIETLANYDTHTISLWVGSVSAGKTISSLLAFFMAIRNTTGEGLIILAGKTLQTIERNLINEMRNHKIFGELADHVHYTRGASTAIILGKVVHLVGANDVRSEEKIRGSTVALAYVDEATILPEGFWEMMNTRLRAKGSKMLATTNPGSTRHWLRTKWILKATEKDMQVFHFVMADNPSLSERYVRNQKASYSGVFYDRFIKGLWTNSEGAIYSMFDPDRHVIRFEDMPEMEKIVSVGVDVGTTHATSAVALGLGVDRKLYLLDELRMDAAGDKDARISPSQQIKQLAEWLGQEHHPTQRGLEMGFTYVDTAAAGFRQEMFYADLMSAPARKDVIAGIGVVSSLLENGQLFISDRCKGVLDEITEYRWDVKATERGTDAPVKELDDSVDSMRYAIVSSEEFWRWSIDAATEQAA